MYILDDLYNGNIHPSEKCYRKGTEYAKLKGRSMEDMERFTEELSDAGKKLFEDYENKQALMADISEQDAFIEGVRFGVMFILDIINPSESQFSYSGS